MEYPAVSLTAGINHMAALNEFDVIIVGAGPAGGQCARELSAAGKSVLLAERNKDFTVNNYSSAGAPLTILEHFELPAHVVGTYWNQFALHSSHNESKWQASHAMGVVLDFMQLRTFLAHSMIRDGGMLKLGCSYYNHERDGDKIKVAFKQHSTKEVQYFKAKILVDATGSERQILAKSHPASTKTVDATGIEYLVETTPEKYQQYAKALSIYMGLKWMPQGYAWIFPMGPNQLKMGVGRYFHNEVHVPHQKSYNYYLENLIKETLGTEKHTIIDKHGKAIVYTCSQKDPHYHQNIIAIGDAVSSINPLGFEGIRHAMTSGRIASKHILYRLDGKSQNFNGYESDMRKYYGMGWFLSEWLMKMIYQEPDDKKIDLMVDVFRSFSFNDLMALIFQYKASKALKFASNYAFYCSRYSIKKMFSKA